MGKRKEDSKILVKYARRKANEQACTGITKKASSFKEEKKRNVAAVVVDFSQDMFKK